MNLIKLDTIFSANNIFSIIEPTLSGFSFAYRNQNIIIRIFFITIVLTKIITKVIFISHQQKKPQTFDRRDFYSKSEISMKQQHVKSQTSMLYQHPTPENTVKYQKSGLVIPSLIVIVIAMCLGGVVNCAGFQSSVAKAGSNK